MTILALAFALLLASLIPCVIRWEIARSRRMRLAADRSLAESRAQLAGRPLGNVKVLGR